MGIFELPSGEDAGEAVDLRSMSMTASQEPAPVRLQRRTFSCRPKDASLSCLNSFGKTSFAS